MGKPLYGSLTVTYRDGTEYTYITYMSHLVDFEVRYGNLADAGVAGTARLAHLVSESPEDFDTWLHTVAYVTAADPNADDTGTETSDGPVEDPVPTG